MTIGELSRRTGVPIRLLREYERLGLVYTLRRSEGNYRLFDETALWCVRQVQRTRALGLTIKEIREVCDAYQGGGVLLAALLKEKLDAARARLEERMAELQAQRARIADVDARLSAAIAAGVEGVVLEPDPRRRGAPRGTVAV